MKDKMQMIRILILIFAITVNLNALKAECLIKLKIENKEPIYAGEIIKLKQTNDYPMTENLNIIIDDKIQIPLFEFKDKTISFLLPLYLDEGQHKIYIYEKLYEECAEVIFTISKKVFKSDTINPYDPDPKTNLGKEIDYSKEKKPIPYGPTVKNPPGGGVLYVDDCDKLHVIDGVFTDSVGDGTIKEWENITPLIGTFSNFYLDYCPKKGILYIMNDWKLGNGNYDSLTCYNEFEFYTARGDEHWRVRIYNSITKGIRVTLNGLDVSQDTNYVVGGRYGFDKSLLVDSNHTMWEFGVKASGGLVTMEMFRDEVGYIGPPNVVLKCDEDGYGTIAEPNLIVGTIDENGSELTILGRYIPLSGVAGLITEPYSFGGVFKGDTAKIYSSKDYKEIINVCSSNHKIDGKFTNDPDCSNEWIASKPAIGMFSNLYAEYCSGKLYILNDWKLGYEEPDRENCYNLFEIITASGKEHWGIYVYNDPKKKPTVFRNGVDVSNDTNFVEDGKYGFDKSPLVNYEHTIYEFAIKAGEGYWRLFLCDPGPSSFCDSYSSLPRKNYDKVKFLTPTGYVDSIKPSFYDTVKVRLVYNNINHLFGNKFIFSINYNQNVFFPLTNKIIDLNKNKFEKFNVRRPKKGLLEIEGYSNDAVFNDTLLIDIVGTILATLDNNSTLYGNLLLGNKKQYTKEFDIKPLNIILETASSIAENQFGNKFLNIQELYPSPTESYINFSVLANYETSLSLEIINYRGEVLLKSINNRASYGINHFTIDVGNLPSGVYLLRVSDGLNMSFYKFVKM